MPASQTGRERAQHFFPSVAADKLPHYRGHYTLIGDLASCSKRLTASRSPWHHSRRSSLSLPALPRRSFNRADPVSQPQGDNLSERGPHGRKHFFGSALARMKLENQALGRSVRPRAIAVWSSAAAATAIDHSDLDSHKNLLSTEAGTAAPRAAEPSPGKPAIPITAELAAYVARRSS